MQLQASKCYYHPERGAVATCAKCGVGICRGCAVKDDRGTIICCSCGNKQLKQDHKEYRKKLKEGGGRFRKGSEFIAPGIVGILIVVVFGALSYFGFMGSMPVYDSPGIDGQGILLSLVYSFVVYSFVAYFLFSIPFCYLALSDLFAPKYGTANDIFSKWYLNVALSFLFGWIFFTFIWIRFIVRKIKSKKNKT